MNSNLIRNTVNILLIALLSFFLQCFDFAHLQSSNTPLQFPGLYLLFSLVNSTLLITLVINSKRRGWGVVLSIALAYYAVSSFLVGLEAVYLSDLLPADVVQSIFINGAITALILSIAAVSLYGKLKPLEGDRPAAESLRTGWGWIWRLPLSGFLYLMLFILVGQAVFQPLARFLDPVQGPAYIESFQVENPIMILAFQWLRGAFWALVSLPLVACLAGSRLKIGMLLGALFGLVMGLQILVPSNIPPLVRIAHTVEVVLENFIFGLIVAWLFGVPGKRKVIESSLPGKGKAPAASI